MRQVQATADEDRAAMLEMVQSKAEELLRREQEGRTMRLLYESEVLWRDELCVWFQHITMLIQFCIFAPVVKTKCRTLVNCSPSNRRLFFIFLCRGEMQVTKGKTKQHKMEAMLRLVAQTSAPIEEHEKDELLLHMTAMYRVRIGLVGTVSRGDDRLFSLLVIRDQGNGGNERRVFYAGLQRRLVTSHGYKNATSVTVDVDLK